MSILPAPASSYSVELARLLQGDRKKTYGDFRAWCVLAFRAARERGDEFLKFRQGNLARIFGVCRETINTWCRWAAGDGLLRQTHQRIQLPDGTWRRTASHYVVAITVRLRGVWAKRWQELQRSAGVVIVPVPIPAPTPRREAQNSALSPAVGSSRQEHSAKSDNLPVSPILATGTAIPHQHRSSWSCRSCQKANAFAAFRCYSCRAEVPPRLE